MSRVSTHVGQNCELHLSTHGRLPCTLQYVYIEPKVHASDHNLYLTHCRVIESKCGDFAVGELIVARIGWQTHTVANAALMKEKWMLKIDPSLPFSPSTAVGVLGMPG